MDVQREISLRNAIKYCIENSDANTSTNRIMEFIRDENKDKALHIGCVSTRLISRVVADLQKELVRTENEIVKRDLEEQIEGLKTLKIELDDFRTIKRILNVR